MSTAIFFVILLYCATINASEVQEAFIENEIVPDVIAKAPENLLVVQYPTTEVHLGTKVTPVQTTNQPDVSWKSSSEEFYTLAMIEPDTPTRETSIMEFDHWLVTNIPGDDVTSGDSLAPYISPATPPATGPHRYIFLVYKQPSRLDFGEVEKLGLSSSGRVKFSIAEFAQKYNLGDPIAGNFFMGELLSSPVESTRNLLL